MKFSIVIDEAVDVDAMHEFNRKMGAAIAASGISLSEALLRLRDQNNVRWSAMVIRALGGHVPEDNGQQIDDTYEDFMARTNRMTGLVDAPQRSLDDMSYTDLTQHDPYSILARDRMLDHIRSYSGQYGHSTYDVWWYTTEELERMYDRADADTRYS